MSSYYVIATADWRAKCEHEIREIPREGVRHLCERIYWGTRQMFREANLESAVRNSHAGPGEYFESIVEARDALNGR